MSTEREQLELAARACGIEVEFYETRGQLFCRKSNDYGPNNRWNPKHDDGDCARMEAALDIDVVWYPNSVSCETENSARVRYFKDHNGDKNAARRAASVAVASEIGRMK